MKNLKLKSIALLIGCILSHFLSYSQDEVKIGKQIWTTKNLNVSKFRNGESIPEAKTESEWKAYGEAEEAAWHYLKFDKANGKKYGKLYNWYAVNDKRGLAPNGFHPPKDEEWTQLIEFLGGKTPASVKLKSKEGWINFLNYESGGGTNSSGFSALPSTGPPYLGEYWSTSDKPVYYKILGDNDIFRTEDTNSSKKGGLSVRCVKD